MWVKKHYSKPQQKLAVISAANQWILNMSKNGFI